MKTIKRIKFDLPINSKNAFGEGFKMNNYINEKQQVINCLEQFNTKQEKPSEVLFNVYPAEMNAIVRLVKTCKKESVIQRREVLIDFLSIYIGCKKTELPEFVTEIIDKYLEKSNYGASNESVRNSLLDEDNDIDTIGKCANCGVEFHIHKELEMTKDECFTKLQLDIPPLESFDFKSMRKQKGLTLRQVEDLTRISNPYLSQLETGKVKSPSYSVVRTLIMLYSTTK